MEKLSNNKGITLITLIVTIIILIILSGVIFLAIANNNIINRAINAMEETDKQTATEKMNFKITNLQIEKYSKENRFPTLQEFADELCIDNEIEYVDLASKKIADLQKIQVGESESIYTKLKEYPYEFEINSSLQLASINGVKVSNNEGTNVSKDELQKMIDEKLKKTEILAETIITDGNQYELNDLITNYERLEIYVGVEMDSAIMWSSSTIHTQDIVLYKNTEEKSKTVMSIIVASNPSYYRYVHLRFPDSNKIETFEIYASGWVIPADGIKLKIYAYK